MSGTKYRDGIEAQADYRIKKGRKEAARGVDYFAPRPMSKYASPRSAPPTIPRSKQIWEALWYGLRPSWMYEREPHYDCCYLRHAAMNLALAWRWTTRRETTDDIEFARGET